MAWSTIPVSETLNSVIGDFVVFFTEIIHNPSVENLLFQYSVLQNAHSGESFQIVVAWGTAVLFLLVCIAVYTTWRGTDSTNSIDVKKTDVDNSASVPTSDVNVTPSSTREESKTRISSFASVQAQRIANSPGIPTGNGSPYRPSAYRDKLRSELEGKSSRATSPLTVLSQTSFNQAMSVVSDPESSSSNSGFTAESTPSRVLSREHSTHVAAESVLTQSISDPNVLIGWRIVVSRYGSGVVLECIKKKFRSTRFRVLFDDGKVRFLKLKRSETKGVVPFTLINTASGKAALHSSRDS